MNLALRLKLLVAGACLAAVWLAWQVAERDLGLPAVVGAIALGGILMHFFRAPVDAFVLGLVLVGYLVGNRGFAQLMPDPRLPLLPAEFALLIGGGWLVVQCAFNRTLPWRRDALNWAVLAWIVAGTARVIFDVRQFGFMAVRDYAMVYYAAFFFLAQHLSASVRSRRYLIRALIFGSVAEPLAFILSDNFQNFFLGTLTVRGIPLILFKGDLALTFMAVGALILAFATDARHRYWTWPLAALELVFVLGGENRASVIGVVVALGWLAFSHVRRFLWAQTVAAGSALMVVAVLALLVQNSWAEKKFDGLRERVASIGDVFGTGTYVSDESSMKGDNNRFRTVWWRSVADETLAQNPAFGLGFGYDLARAFLEEYNPEMAEDFSARSPHSIILSAFGRMGFVGLTLFALLCGVFAHRTWRAMRNQESETLVLGLWACIWTILISACFGVVLEGPMGAVVFWSLLGMANAIEAKPTEEFSSSEAPTVAAVTASVDEAKSGEALPTAGHSA